MELIIDIIYIYLAVFSLYFFIIAVCSLNERKFEIDRKYLLNAEQSQLCTIIYSQNDYDSLKNMLNLLNQQEYDTEKSIIYVILDNCTDHSEELIPENDNIKLLNINDGVTIGKDQAISILLESLRPNTSIDSYVFLDVNRYIEPNFLKSVNGSLHISPVITGQTIVIENKNMSKREKIKVTYTKYNNLFLRKARALFKLSDKINSNIFAIKKELVDKIDALDLSSINTELKYSIL